MSFMAWLVGSLGVGIGSDGVPVAAVDGAIVGFTLAPKPVAGAPPFIVAGPVSE